MNKYYSIILIFFIKSLFAVQTYSWVVVGSGPAGIVAVAQLLENGVNKSDILWIDPEFKVGRLGKFYSNVPSNHKVHQFVTFLNSCAIFQEIQTPAFDAVENHDQNVEARLQLIIEPLQDITDYFMHLVHTKKAFVQEIRQEHGLWKLFLEKEELYGKNVILAHGSHPKRYSYPGVTEIPLDLALDECKLKNFITYDDTIMVIGSAHSALLILKYLTEFPIKKVINIYTKLPSYVKDRALSGITAWWTQEVLEKNPPHNLQRILFYDSAIKDHLRECTKIIYAFGYEPDPIRINNSLEHNFDQTTGIILPHLYGIGIAYPREQLDLDGGIMRLVGLNAFMKYAKELVPQWIAAGTDCPLSLEKQQ